MRRPPHHLGPGPPPPGFGDYVFVRERIRGVRLRGSNVGSLQARISRQQVRLARPLTQFAQHELHGNARAWITGLPSMTFGLTSIRFVRGMV
jgi:hypothetical protein